MNTLSIARAFALSLIFAFFSGGCSDDEIGGANRDVSDAKDAAAVRDAADGGGASDISGRDVTSDLSSDGSDAVARDAQIDASGDSACECISPLDECSGQRCVRAGVDCRDDATSCPEGYACVEETGQCNCTGESWETTPDACGPICDETPECPTRLTCDPDSGLCRQGKTCRSSARCPDGEICVEFEPGFSKCTTPGVGSVGDACARPADCESGVCEDGVCKSGVCLDDTDCAEGEACTGETGVGHGTVDGCTERDERCPESCPEGESCIAGTCRTSLRCRVTGDCEEGDCLYGVRSQLGYCGSDEADSAERHCKPDEWRRSAVQSGEPMTYCFVNVLCWSDANCEPPYTCIGGSSASSQPTRCGRVAEPS